MTSRRPCLVPELVVSDYARSRAFYLQLGFTVLWDRPENGFACLDLEGNRLMIEQMGEDWRVAPLEPPFGRGINLEISVVDLASVAARIEALQWPFFRSPYEESYRVRDSHVRVRQALVQDPDGYLLRFQQDLGAV
jgi:catechol 2,3-dioxygenase-like lactoylglutathione lyase family enzyme